VKWRKRIATLTLVASLATIAIVATPLPLPIPAPHRTPAPVRTARPAIIAATPAALPRPTVSLLRLLPASTGILVDYRSDSPRIALFVQDANDVQTFTATLPGTGKTVLPLASLPKSGAFSIVVQARRGDAVGSAEIMLPSVALATAPLHPVPLPPTVTEPITMTPRWVATGDIVTISRYATIGTTTVAVKRADETTVELTTLPPGSRTAFVQAPQPGRYTVEIATNAGASADTSILPLVVMPTRRR
jgi:hypothetical protein